MCFGHARTACHARRDQRPYEPPPAPTGKRNKKPNCEPDDEEVAKMEAHLHEIKCWTDDEVSK